MVLLMSDLTVSWNVVCFDTQDGIVRRSLVGRGGGLRCAETGMWSDVVESCVRGSQCVFVCGCRSCSVEVKMFV